jgi:hypothetical protein
MRSPYPSRRTVVRLVLRSIAVAAAVTLTVALAEHPSSSVFTASTADSGNRVTAAADFCGAPDMRILYPTEDAAGYLSQRTTNFGDHVSLGALSAPTANTRSVLRFGGPLPTVPTGCVLTATLRLRASSSTAGRKIDVYRIDPAATGWRENTVTWDAMPPTTGTAVWSDSLGQAGWQEWTVTPLMPGLYATNSGFLVRDRTEDSNPAGTQVYDSRNTTNPANRPQLVLTWG